MVISSYPNHPLVPTPNPVQRDAPQAEFARALLIDESSFCKLRCVVHTPQSKRPPSPAASLGVSTPANGTPAHAGTEATLRRSKLTHSAPQHRRPPAPLRNTHASTSCVDPAPTPSTTPSPPACASELGRPLASAAGWSHSHSLPVTAGRHRACKRCARLAGSQVTRVKG